jgi:hypothetical protein
MKTVLLSALTRQFLILGTRFAERYTNDWLVWEAGTMTVPRRNIATANTVTEPLEGSASAPRAGDPLCFLLEHPLDGATFTIGRSEGNDLVLSDETVSRHHCTLVWNSGRWSVSAAEEGHALMLDGHPLPFGSWSPFSSGQTLMLGHLSLSLYTARGMVVRLAQKLSRR